MVRVYLKPRWSKKTINADLLDKSLALIGGPRSFSKSKIIHSMACYLNKDNQLFTINIQEGSPFAVNDFWVLSFL